MGQLPAASLGAPSSVLRLWSRSHRTESPVSSLHLRPRVWCLVRNPCLETLWREKFSSLSFPVCSSLYLRNAEISALLIFWYEIIFFPTSLSSEGWIGFSRGLIFAIVLLFPLPGAGQTVSPGVKRGASVCCSDSPWRGGCDCSRGRIFARPRSLSPSGLWRWGSSGLSVSRRPPRTSPLVKQ